MTDENLNGAYTVKEFCRAFSVGRTFFYEEVKTGRLMAKKARAKTLILKTEADRWARALPALTATTSRGGTTDTDCALVPQA